MKDYILEKFMRIATSILILILSHYKCREMQGNIKVGKLDYQLTLKILNEETVSEADKKLCPDCKSPYIAYNSHEHYHCTSCNHEWT